MKLFRWTTCPISGLFRLSGRLWLVGLFSLVLALSPQGATAQGDQMLQDVYARARAMGLPTPPVGGVATPSFDCRRATTPSERAICATPELAQLDQDLAVAYAALPRRDDRFLIASQRAWWQQREACGNSIPCLQRRMTERLAELRHWPDSTYAGPETGPPTIAPIAAAGGPSAASDQAAVNGAAAAAQWRLPTRLGLPLADASNTNGSDVGLAGLFDYVSDLKPEQIEWTKGIVALSLSLAPDTAAQMSPAAILSLACLYLPPSRFAALAIDARQPCGPIRPPMPGEEFKQRDSAASFRLIDLPSILRDAPRLPLKLLFVMPLTPKLWDETREGFPLASSGNPSLFGAPLRFKFPDFWPAPMAIARPFVESRRAYAPVYLAIPVTITGTTDLDAAAGPLDSPPGGLNAHTGLPMGLAWQFEFGDIALYGDAALTQKLYEFGRPPSPPRPAIGTAAAEKPHPASPVQFNTETPLLVASRFPASPDLPIDWAKAAEARMMLDRGLRAQAEWAKQDPWGVFFRLRSGEDRKPDPAEIVAFRDWTERRARSFPGGFVFADIPAYPSAGVGPRRLEVFNPYNDAAWSRSSAVPFRSIASGSDKKLPAEVARHGVTPTRIIPLDMRFAGIDAPVLAVLPRDRQDYVLELPNGAPAQRPALNDTIGIGSTLDVEVVVDAIEPVAVDDGRRVSKLVLLRVQPIGATLRSTSGQIIASASFPHMPWSAVTPPPPVLWPPPAPGPVEQALSAPYGPELYGVRLGMSSGEAEPEIRARMRVGRVLDLADSSRALADNERSFMRTIDGRMFVSDDFQNSVAVFTSRVAPTGRVVAVWHRTSADGDHWQKALQTLVAKYGPPVGTPGSAAFWGDRSMLAGGARSRCNGDGVGRYAWENWTENGHPVKLSPSGSGPLDGPAPPLLRDADIPDNGAGATKLADCFPVLYARTASGNPSTVETRLFDMRALALLRAQAASAPPRTVGGAAISANAPVPAPAPVDPRLTTGPYGPDVVGLHLGMTFTEAEALIRTKMNVTLVAETTAPSGTEAAGPAGLFHGKMFVGDDRTEEYFGERIAIFDAPAQASGRVVAIERVGYLEAGLWDRASQELLAKYGPAADRLSLSNWLVWLERGDGNCLLRQSFSRHQWRAAGRDENRLKGPQLQEVPLPAAPNLQAVYPRCGTVIEIIDSGRESGTDGKPLERLHTLLYDTALLARLLNNHAAQTPNSDMPMKF